MIKTPRGGEEEKRRKGEKKSSRAGVGSSVKVVKVRKKRPSLVESNIEVSLTSNAFLPWENFCLHRLFIAFHIYEWFRTGVNQEDNNL